MWLLRSQTVDCSGVCSPADTECAPARAGLNPLDVVAKVRELLAKLAVVEGPDALSREAQRNATLLFFAHARAMLASKRVLREHRLSAEALDYVIGEIEARFHKARPHPPPPPPPTPRLNGAKTCSRSRKHASCYL